MFNAKTEKIKYLAEKYPQRISELEKVFDKKTNVYIDFANAIRWQEKLHWHFDLRRLKQFLDSFENINSVKFYSGTLIGDEKSETFIREVEKIGYNIHTKPVKIMKLSIDVSSIPENSLALLENFIRKSLLKQFDLGTIEHLNKKLKELNAKGIKFVEDRKCNFDVEIGRDMLLDYNKNGVENFVLWSGDSDFADPISQLLKDNKKVAVFATSKRISAELGDLRNKGLFIFDIQKIRNFICWKKEIQ
ncbi:MAG: hypothetical protein A3G45_01020 [Candidatus Staskawiczbacteria bacterium RIFCSPLOWO2_12_FULL_37_15]|uniref:NYN domain-containing protein n=1 Tax=Candidatus Staskawiczbacteria bacterium RIFCSPLOWO2_12_FULL_37_15 TaxID=1802218 RepID=A0A1G2ILF4_9BACT|nr:MAG: hypothetical protein A3G45_01020 [Candidatus Staskawiczbacteria bacterium RIFCSPLOWO2_12_FULL_37_15]